MQFRLRLSDVIIQRTQIVFILSIVSCEALVDIFPGNGSPLDITVCVSVGHDCCTQLSGCLQRTCLSRSLLHPLPAAGSPTVLSVDVTFMVGIVGLDTVP